MHDRHVLIMHGAEHLLGELHIPLVGFQNLLGVVAQVTQLEKRDHPRGEQQPDDTQESNGYSSSNSRHTRLTVKIVPNRPYRQGSPPTRTYPERCNKYNARQGQKQTCLNLTELQAVFRKTVQGGTNAESGSLHRNSFLQEEPDGKQAQLFSLARNTGPFRKMQCGPEARPHPAGMPKRNSPEPSPDTNIRRNR